MLQRWIQEKTYLQIATEMIQYRTHLLTATACVPVRTQATMEMNLRVD